MYALNTPIQISMAKLRPDVIVFTAPSCSGVVAVELNWVYGPFFIVSLAFDDSAQYVKFRFIRGEPVCVHAFQYKNTTNIFLCNKHDSIHFNDD